MFRLGLFAELAHQGLQVAHALPLVPRQEHDALRGLDVGDGLTDRVRRASGVAEDAVEGAHGTDLLHALRAEVVPHFLEGILEGILESEPLVDGEDLLCVGVFFKQRGGWHSVR